MGQTRVFFTGATGYIGGTVLTKTLAYFRDAGKDVSVRVLVRNEAKKALVQKWAARLGVSLEYVMGSLDNVEVIETEVATADISIDTADADHFKAQEAFLRGLDKAIAAGKHPLYIHTSGTGLLVDGVYGSKLTDKIYDDAKDEDIASIPDDAPHRDVDLLLLNWIKANEGRADLMIVSPPTIWGPGSGPDNIWSVQVPLLITTALKHKQTYSVGKGLNHWTQINVLDLADFYALLLHKGLEAPDKHSGFYFANSDEFAYGDVCRTIQKTLIDIGIATTTDIKTPESVDEIHKYFEPFPASSIGGNSRARASKAKALGWKPRFSSNDEFFEDARKSTLIFARYPRW